MPITNAGDRDADDRSKGIGRFITTKHGVVESLEKDHTTVPFARKRALFDVRLGQIAASLRLKNERSPQSPPLYIPRTAGRFLITGKGCPRQVLHTDFEVTHGGNDYQAAPSHPGYFVMAAGKDEFPIWVWERSHVFCNALKQAVEQLSSAVVVKKHIVPAYSVLICRGDVFHCGASYEDGKPGRDQDRDADTGNDALWNLRYYMYIVREGIQVKDGIHLRVSLNPPFLEDGSDGSGSENERHSDEDAEHRMDVAEDNGKQARRHPSGSMRSASINSPRSKSSKHHSTGGKAVRKYRPTETDDKDSSGDEYDDEEISSESSSEEDDY